MELAKEATDEISTRMTAKVIKEGVDAEILAGIEAEDGPSLLRFNNELMDKKYRHIMLVDGNDERGIDVGIMTNSGFPIRSIRSNVDAEDAVASCSPGIVSNTKWSPRMGLPSTYWSTTSRASQVVEEPNGSGRPRR